MSNYSVDPPGESWNNRITEKAQTPTKARGITQKGFKMTTSQKLAVVLLSTVAEGEIELPAGKTVDDMDYYYVKLGIVYITWKDGTQTSHDSEARLVLDSIDWKRPDAELYEIDPETGDTDYAARVV